jgi:adenine-specific DNA-methyltransferase
VEEESIVNEALADILACVIALDGPSFGGPLSPAEQELLANARTLPQPPPERLDAIRQAIADGGDPLGDAYCTAVSPDERRPAGAFYTPDSVVLPMVRWVLDQHPVRVVDPGAGSGRYAAAVARLSPDMEIIAVDRDPLTTLICRAHLAVVGARNARVVQADYTTLELPRIDGRTAYVGNPPYVRHHSLSKETKVWAKDAASRLGIKLSGLAGLHVMFFLATALLARSGDVGCFITSAEWLTVGYGSALRKLLAGPLGMLSMHRLDPQHATFDDAMTTALITAFQVGATTPEVRVQVVERASDLDHLGQGGRLVARQSLADSQRWDACFSDEPDVAPVEGLVPLGSLMRVKRGVATGANKFFIMTKQQAVSAGLSRFARPVLTAAREVFNSPGEVRNGPTRRVLIDLPPDLDLSAPEMEPVRRYIAEGEKRNIHKRYLCKSRSPWWSVRAGNAPSIVATYMARQAPAFALNPDGLLLVNVVHGLYPRVDLTPAELEALVHWLNESRAQFRGSGRTYQGGLEKFEPKEMEQLLVPARHLLAVLARELLDSAAAAYSRPAALDRGAAGD